MVDIYKNHRCKGIQLKKHFKKCLNFFCQIGIQCWVYYLASPISIRIIVIIC